MINVQRRTPTSAEILAKEEKNEEKVQTYKKKAEKKRGQDNSRQARYQRRQIKEEVKEEMEEDEEKEEQEDDELDGERVDDEHADFPSSSASPSSAPSSSSSSPSASPSPPATLPDSMDRVDGGGRIFTSCTLVVCPVSLVGQWANELAEKSSRPLRILLYHGGSRPRKVPQLLNYDVIITSYGIAASELTLGNNRAKRMIDKTPWLYKGRYAPEYQSLLNRLHWHRVILDESHVIRTMNSIQCRAAYELVGDRVWMLTGTVVNTSLMDLKGQCKFLDMKGLSVGQVWTDIDNILVQHKTYDNRRADRSGKLRRTLLQTNRLKLLFVNLVTKSMIRHEKRQQFNGRPALISLPPKRVQTIMVQPTADEKRAMDEMFQHAKNRFEQYKADNVAVRRSVEVLQLLQPLRIACSGGSVDMVAHRERMKSELDRDAVRSVMEKVKEKGSLTADKVELASASAISQLSDDCAVCCTGDHRVLTRSGWRSITLVQVGDEVLSFNIEKRLQEWKPVRAVTSRDVTSSVAADTLYRLQGNDMDVIATRDHRMLVARLTQDTPDGLQVEQPIDYETIEQLLPLSYTDVSPVTQFAHCPERAVVCTGLNTQLPVKVVIPGLERVCDWWWQQDRQLGFLRFLGFWLGDGFLGVNHGVVCISQHKKAPIKWLDALLDVVFPRWWYHTEFTTKTSVRHTYTVRCPPLYNYLRLMAVGPLGYNPRDPTQLRSYPHFTRDEELAMKEQQSDYYKPDNNGGYRSWWTEDAMLAAFAGRISLGRVAPIATLPFITDEQLAKDKVDGITYCTGQWYSGYYYIKSGWVGRSCGTCGERVWVANTQSLDDVSRVTKSLTQLRNTLYYHAKKAHPEAYGRKECNNAGQDDAECYVCHSRVSDEKADLMLLCDGDGFEPCQRGLHLRCSQWQKTPEGDWHCDWHSVCGIAGGPMQPMDVEETKVVRLVVVDHSGEAGDYIRLAWMMGPRPNIPLVCSDEWLARHSNTHWGGDEDELMVEEKAPTLTHTLGGSTVAVPLGQVLVVEDEAQAKALSAAGAVVWWNNGWWIIINGHWFYLKRWLGEQNVVNVYSQLSQKQAVALLDGFCRADGRWSSIEYDKVSGEPKGQWECSNSSFPLIDHLMLIGQLAGAAVELTLHTKAGKSRVIEGRTVTFSVDHWQLFFTFNKKSPTPFQTTPLAQPLDVSTDLDGRGYYQYKDDGKVYCITVADNTNFLTQRLSNKRLQSGNIGVRAHPVFVGNCLGRNSETSQHGRARTPAHIFMMKAHHRHTLFSCWKCLRSSTGAAADTMPSSLLC